MNALRSFLLVISFVMLMLVRVSFAVSADASLDEEKLSLVNSAVFEVVVPKLDSNSLKYENPLPLSRIPYAIRIDKYYSIGTAFAIGPSQLVSAAHVMNLSGESQYKEVYIRDREGKVYHIDKITKYSERKDFIVFSLKEKKAERYLQVNNSPQMNQRVYAVGNALGEGVVIRDGLYTSSTPEEEEGVWKWIRFSAAASPGNSGGPLLDREGKVIGIVIGKSPSENLNYALPIAEVLNARDGTAVAHRKVHLAFDHIRRSHRVTYKKEILLPKPYSELSNELTDGFRLFLYRCIEDFFTKEKGSLFPLGKGTGAILHSTYDTTFPNLILQKEDGNWYASYPREIQTAELGSNGRIRYGAMNSTIFLHLQKPDDVPLEKLYSDSKLLMELILKGIQFSRYVGDTTIRITSMGEASEDYVFLDSYGRKWQVRSWPLEYSDEKVVVLSLPVPNGYIAMLMAGQTGIVDNDHIIQGKVFTNFIYLSYSSTLKQWEEFLKMRKFLPLAFSEINASIDYQKAFQYRSKRFSFSYDSEDMEISEKSMLKLLFSYFKEGGKTVWDVAAVRLDESNDSATSLHIARHIRPQKELEDAYKTGWTLISEEKFPYSNASYRKGAATSIATVIKGPDVSTAPFLYSISYDKNGTVDQKEMQEKLAKFMNKVVVHEYTQGYSATYAMRSDAYHDKGEYHHAIYDDKFKAMHPETPDDYILRGSMYERKGDIERALGEYTQAVQISPGYAPAYLNRALIYLKRKDVNRGLSELNNAIELNPKYAEAYYNRGRIYQGKGMFDKAILDYNKALELHEVFAAALVARGNTYTEIMEFERAVSDYNKAIEISPREVLAYINRGIFFWNRGEHSKAFSDYNKALEIDPNSAEAYAARGRAYVTRGQVQNALDDLNKALQIDPTHAKAYDGRGIAYSRKKEFSLAIADFNKSLELNGANAESYNNRGYTFMLTKQFDRAIDDLCRSIEINSKFTLAYINRGNAYAIVGKKAEACADWKQACEQGSCDSISYAREKGYCSP